MKKIVTVYSALLALSFTLFISVSKADDDQFSKEARPANPGIDVNEVLNRSEDPNSPLFTQANPGVLGYDCVDCLKNTYQKPRDKNSIPRAAGPGSGSSDSKATSTSSPDGTR